MDILLCAAAVGLCYLAFWLFAKTYDPSFNKIVAWGCGVLSGIFASYFITFAIENCIIASMIAFMSSISLKAQDDQAVKNIFETKQTRSKDSRGLDILLGFLNLLLAVGVLVGIIICAVVIF